MTMTTDQRNRVLALLAALAMTLPCVSASATEGAGVEHASA